ncbi:MAG: phage portal protein [Hyphomonas sp.]
MGILDLFRRKAEPLQLRRFDGAAGGRRGFGMGQFGRINPEIAAAGQSLRSRASYLAMNNPWVAQGVANWTGALVGPGLQPTSKHPDPEMRRAINAFFETWAERADAEGLTDFWGQQAAIAHSMVVAGEGLALLIDSDDGPQIRVLPPELLDEAKTVELSEGRTIFAGVELDQNGRRVAFHILPERPASTFASYAPAQRVDADSVLHVFRPNAPGQVRGVSWLAQVILTASDTDGYEDALLMAAKVAAMHSGFIVDVNGATTDPHGGADTASMEPGALIRLGLGEDIKFNSPQQLQQADAFLRHNLRKIAAGMGLPDHLVSGDLSGANYSSLRAGLLPFRQRVEQVQYGVLVPRFLSPVWRAVITHGILSGGIAAPDFEQNPRDYLSADWLAPKPLQVDPMKDLAATRAELELGLTSRRKAVAERGWVLEDLDAEIQADAFGKTLAEQKDSEK